jgi:hypothetical protein
VVIDFAYGKGEFYRESEVLNLATYTPSPDQLELGIIKKKSLLEHVQILSVVMLNVERLNSKVDLHKCFKAFTEAEVLAGNDEWYCKMCKKHVKVYISWTYHCNKNAYHFIWI